MSAPNVQTLEDAQHALDQAYARISQLEAEVQKVLKRLAAASIP